MLIAAVMLATLREIRAILCPPKIDHLLFSEAQVLAQNGLEQAWHIAEHIIQLYIEGPKLS